MRGDVLLVRMDDRSEPQDVTLEEWETFECTSAAEAATANGAAAGDGEGAGDRQKKRQRRR